MLLILSLFFVWTMSVVVASVAAYVYFDSGYLTTVISSSLIAITYPLLYIFLVNYFKGTSNIDVDGYAPYDDSLMSGTDEPDSVVQGLIKREESMFGKKSGLRR